MPDYREWTWMRALNRTVTQISPGFYRIDADLSPGVALTPCPADQTHQFSGTQSFDGFMYEISGVEVTPVDTGSLSNQLIGTLPYQAPSVTPTFGGTAMLIAGYIFDNEGDTAAGLTNIGLTAIDQDSPNIGSPGAAPEGVRGHLLINPAGGTYSPDVLSTPSPFNDYGEGRGWASQAAVFMSDPKQGMGAGPAIVQTKYGSSFGGGMTITLNAVPTGGNLLVCFLAARNMPGNLAAVTAGWTALGTITTPLRGGGVIQRYGRMFYKEVCPDG